MNNDINIKEFKNRKKLFNETYCCFNNDGNTLKDLLATSFIDYLNEKEDSKTLADKSKES